MLCVIIKLQIYCIPHLPHQWQCSQLLLDMGKWGMHSWVKANYKHDGGDEKILGSSGDPLLTPWGPKILLLYRTLYLSFKLCSSKLPSVARYFTSIYILNIWGDKLSNRQHFKGKITNLYKFYRFLNSKSLAIWWSDLVILGSLFQKLGSDPNLAIAIGLTN